MMNVDNHSVTLLFMELQLLQVNILITKKETMLRYVVQKTRYSAMAIQQSET